MKTPRRFLSAIVMALLTISAAAQDAGPSRPDETEIIIPEFVLQIEDLGVEQVDAVLPSDQDLTLGSIELPLPAAGELQVSDLVFDAPLPSTAVATNGPTVFSTGRLGAGTANRIVGELSIYKLGEDPRFRLGFAHEGLDGYQFRPTGTGSYSFTNAIDAWLSTEADVLEVEGEGSFIEAETGLQDLSDFNAVSIRTTNLSAGLRYLPDPLVQLTGGVDGSLATRRQTASGTATVPTDQEYVLEPSLGARVSIRALDLVIDSSYFLRSLAGGSIPTQQDLDLTAGFELALPSSLVVAGHAGIHWDFVTGLQYPWRLAVRGIIGGLELGAMGGYEVQRLRLTDLWALDPLMAVGDSVAPAALSNNSTWFATADARWTGLSGLALRAEVAFTSESGAVDLQPYDEATDQFPFVQQAFTSLLPTLEAAWQPSSLWQFEAGVVGNFFDRPFIQPAAEVDGAVRYASESGVFHIDVEGRSRFYPEPDIPFFEVEGTINAGEGVEVVLQLSDILAPINDTGRAVHGADVTASYPFIEPGFVATILTRITL